MVGLMQGRWGESGEKNSPLNHAGQHDACHLVDRDNVEVNQIVNDLEKREGGDVDEQWFEMAGGEISH